MTQEKDDHNNSGSDEKITTKNGIIKEEGGNSEMSNQPQSLAKLTEQITVCNDGDHLETSEKEKLVKSDKPAAESPISNDARIALSAETHDNHRNGKSNGHGNSNDKNKLEKKNTTETMVKNGTDGDEEMILIKTNGTVVEMTAEDDLNPIDKGDNSKLKIITVKEKRQRQRKCLLIGIIVLLVIITAALIGMLIHHHHYSTVNYTFRLANFFRDDMIIQRAPVSARIWGYGPAKPENATVLIVLKNKTGQIIQSHITRVVLKIHQQDDDNTDNNNNINVWSVHLNPTEKGGPYSLEIKLDIKNGDVNDNSMNKYSLLTLKNLYFGDVWLCAGSNPNHDEIIINKIDNSIRLFKMTSLRSDLPLNNIQYFDFAWLSSTSLKRNPHIMFSSACYDFGVKLSKKLNTHIGLISATFKDSEIDEWTNKNDYNSCNADMTLLDGQQKRRIINSTLWNSMINPLLNQHMKGIIFHQGEGDSLKGYNYATYGCLFRSFLNTLKSHIDNVAFIQLGDVSNGKLIVDYKRIRWLQTSSYGYVPNKLMSNIFMISSIDLPSTTNDTLMKRNSHELSNRMLLFALNSAYKWLNVSIQVAKTTNIVTVANNVLILKFDKSLDERYAIHFQTGGDLFQACCTPKNFSKPCPPFANEEIKWVVLNFLELQNTDIYLQSNNTLCPPSTKKLQGIRYAWKIRPCEFKQCGLYDMESQLPIGPFLYPKIVGFHSGQRNILYNKFIMKTNDTLYNLF